MSTELAYEREMKVFVCRLDTTVVIVSHTSRIDATASRITSSAIDSFNTDSINFWGWISRRTKCCAGLPRFPYASG